MSTTLENPIPIKTGEVPKVALKLITGTQEEEGRTAGVFTVDDLINILLYVRESEKLPSNLAALVADLGTDKTGIPGLEPAEIIALYLKVREHAKGWSPVEKLVRGQSSKLKTVSEDIVITGGYIIKIIGEMDIIAQMKDIGNSDLKIPISTDKDKKIKIALPQVIAKLKETCSDQQQKTRVVLNAVRDYRTEIYGGTLTNGNKVDGLEPAVADKKERAKKANLDGKIRELQTDIDSLSTQIDQLQKDYDKYVGLAFTGAAGGPIGLAVTGGIFGAKAEAARKEKNRLVKQKNDESKELQRDQLIQGALNVFATQFTNVGMRLLDAQQALSHLDFLWTDILSRIDSSVEKWAKVEDSEMLMIFQTDLQSIVNPWSEIGNMTEKLSKVFDQAYTEFRKTYKP